MSTEAELYNEFHGEPKPMGTHHELFEMLPKRAYFLRGSAEILIESVEDVRTAHAEKTLICVNYEDKEVDHIVAAYYAPCGAGWSFG